MRQKLLEEAERKKTENHLKLQALWGHAENHAVRKGGRFSMAWQEIPGVSEDHLFKFHERHGIRVRVSTKERISVDHCYLRRPLLSP